jgi:hypothetical protein
LVEHEADKKMADATRTLNPLHFEDLEPHRFEDLVRQLIYDFREWRRLEATGRSGSDDGFDARAWEIVGTISDATDDNEERDDDSTPIATADTDRLWLVQCKRERRIGPKQIATYVDAIDAEEVKKLYGIIFAACCDFSKATRDAFRVTCLARGLREWHLWGKAELEDMLFRPANDHLLFAYFGISLQIRKRSLKSTLATRLSTKRRVLKHLIEHDTVLLRDASDDRYPWLDENTTLERIPRGRWLVRRVHKIKHDGVHFLLRSYFAFLDDDGVRWDYAESAPAPIVQGGWEDPWGSQVEHTRMSERVEQMRPVWEAIPEGNRANLSIYGMLPFDSILALDENGDEYLSKVHVYTSPWTPARGPFAFTFPKLVTIQGEARANVRSLHPDMKSNRVQVFARESRDSKG